MPTPDDATAKRRELVREVQDRIRSRDIDGARLVTEQGLEDVPNSVQLRDCLISILDLTDETQAALELAIDNARRRIRRLEHRRQTPSQPRVLQPRERVFISGYFYSGSGAVLDYLRGFPGCVKWTPAGEMRLIKFPGGLADLAKRFRRNRGLEAQDLVDLYLHVSGWKAITTPEGVYNRHDVVNRNSRKLFGAPEAAGYLLACLQHFLDLADRWRQGPLERADLHDRFRHWVKDALDAAATDTGAHHLLVDQGVTAWRIRIAKLVPPSTFIVVHRDPRDQFAEVQKVLSRPGRRPKSAPTFAQAYRRDRELVASWIPKLESSFGHRFLQVSFEEFVMEHAGVAHEVRNMLGLEGEPTQRHFDPSESCKNVGKHRGLIRRRDARKLTRRLPEYLSPHASA